MKSFIIAVKVLLMTIFTDYNLSKRCADMRFELSFIFHYLGVGGFSRNRLEVVVERVGGSVTGPMTLHSMKGDFNKLLFKDTVK